MRTEEIFLHLVGFGTQSDESSESTPSTPGQLVLANELVRMMKEMGIADARVDQFGYVYGSIPATDGGKAPAIGLIAHMDTATELSGENIRARVVPDYDGGDVVLNQSLGIVLSPEQFPQMRNFTGKRLIVTDGTTLLGADDKAGVAEILAAAEELLQMDGPHGAVKIAFTPDEEIGRGAGHFDVAAFGANFAYTVDGGAVGELEYENFNAASAVITVSGENIHPGSAKNQMKNSLHIAMEFDSLLPKQEIPAATEGYEGFFHLGGLSGEVEQTTMNYLLRDFSKGGMERRKRLMIAAADFLNEKYGEKTVKLQISDSYFNMKEQLLPHPEIIELAKNAMRAVGVEPKVIPIRGGTDGAKLSFMGLPCPNLCTGGQNGHGRFEFTVTEEMEKVKEILLSILELAAKE